MTDGVLYLHSVVTFYIKTGLIIAVTGFPKVGAFLTVTALGGVVVATVAYPSVCATVQKPVIRFVTIT